MPTSLDVLLEELPNSNYVVGGSRLGHAARAAAVTGIRSARRNLTSEVTGFAIRKKMHIGAPAHAADSRTHQDIERSLYSSLEDVVILGEEVDREGFVTTHTTVAVVDPIDGTTPARALLSDYSSVALLYATNRGTLTPRAVAIATGSAYVVCVDEEGTLGCHDLLTGESVDLRAPSDEAPQEPTIAVVAAKSKDSGALRLIREAYGDAVVFNCGGSPSIVGLLCGELSASVAMTHQTVWDAAHLYVAVRAGLHAVLLSEPSKLLTVNDVEQLFSDPPLQAGPAVERKSIPPFVVGRHVETIASLAAGLALRRRAESGYGEMLPVAG